MLTLFKDVLIEFINPKPNKGAITQTKAKVFTKCKAGNKSNDQKHSKLKLELFAFLTRVLCTTQRQTLSILKNKR